MYAQHITLYEQLVPQIPENHSNFWTLFLCLQREDSKWSDSHMFTTVLPTSLRFCWTKWQESHGTKAVSTVCDALLYSSRAGDTIMVLQAEPGSFLASDKSLVFKAESNGVPKGTPSFALACNSSSSDIRRDLPLF